MSKITKKVEENKVEENKVKKKIEQENYLKMFNNSWVFKISNSKCIKKLKEVCLSLPGIYYMLIHMMLMGSIIIIILFVTNKVYLCITLLIISLDAIANVICFDCPLSSLEKKYLNYNGIETRINILQKSGIMYSNNKIYDTQLEVIINGWSLCAFKLTCLILLDWFSSAKI